jgi:N-acetylglucosamine transport system permease protein
MENRLSVPKPRQRGYSAFERLRDLTPRLPAYIFLGAWAAFTIFAFVWVILTSFKTNQQLFANVWSLPTHIEWKNYVKAWNVVRMKDYFINSVVVVTLATLAIVTISAPASYVLSRVPFKSRELLTSFFTSGMGVPRVLLLVPLFMLMNNLKLTDSLFGLGIVYVAISLSFTILLLTAFFATLPTELEEAAAIDGASPFATFWRVMLPLAGPGISTAFTFNFIWLWKEYFWALVLISTDSKRTISLGLYSLQGSMQYSADWVGLFAGCVIVMVPTLILYFVMSERIMSGITVGAIKG